MKIRKVPRFISEYRDPFRGSINYFGVPIFLPGYREPSQGTEISLGVTIILLGYKNCSKGTENENSFGVMRILSGYRGSARGVKNFLWASRAFSGYREPNLNIQKRLLGVLLVKPRTILEYRDLSGNNVNPLGVT